jgi:two-component system sensor histidine kinase AlgZ
LTQATLEADRGYGNRPAGAGHWRRDAAAAVGVWLAATGLMAAHFWLLLERRPAPAELFAWLAMHTGGWLLVALLLVGAAPSLAGLPVRQLAAAHLAGAALAAVGQPLLQLAGMRFLGDGLGLSPVFSTPGAAGAEALRAIVVGKLGTSLAAYAGLAVIAHLLVARRQLRGARLRQADLEARARAAELRALHPQLRPHFLLNALNSVVALVEEDPAAAERMLIRIADLLRSTLAADGGAPVALARELQWSRAYLDIEQIRFGERLAVRWEVEDEVLSRDVPPLILLPVIENAVKHGIGACEAGGEVAVRAGRRADRLRLEVVTRLAASPRRRAAAGTRLGLDAVRRRLEAFAPGRTTVELERGAGHSRVVLDLPWQEAG